MASAQPAQLEVGVSVVVVSKNERSLAVTLDALARQVVAFQRDSALGVEVLVVDASAGRLRDIEVAHRWVRWIDFTPPEGVRVSIAHQRNVGVKAARGDVIVFTDCGCVPAEGWLGGLVAPIRAGRERLVCGETGAIGRVDPHRWGRAKRAGADHVLECPTINLGFERSVFDELGGFDERFAYGSDIDFSWRAVHRGIRISYADDAVVLHDWGTWQRQLRRAYLSGVARARLYDKHVVGSSVGSVHKRRLAEHDLVPLVYPVYLLGLPLSLWHPSYLLLLLVPLARARHHDPVPTLVDHLVQGVGVLVGGIGLVHGRHRGSGGALRHGVPRHGDGGGRRGATGARERPGRG